MNIAIPVLSQSQYLISTKDLRYSLKIKDGDLGHHKPTGKQSIRSAVLPSTIVSEMK